MFAYIKGNLEYKYNDHVVVEANGIGYKIHTAFSTIESIGPVGSDVTLFTHVYMRDDVINIYGFRTREELRMFELLITVSGVGPKAAVSIISALSPSKFSLAVITGDVRALTKAQGIGNKTAQRVILELKDKIKKEQAADVNTAEKQDLDISDNSRVGEAISALMMLGYSALEAGKAVSAVYSDDMDLETIIRNSLKGLGR